MESSGTKISVIIPVLHESGIIGETIKRLQCLAAESIEIIVVDGDPAGGTVNTIGDSSIITARSAKGRAGQMNHGSSLASGAILVFLHADTWLPDDAFDKIGDALGNGFAAGAFTLGIRSDRRIFRVTERYVAWRTRLSRIPFGDQAMFFQSDYFRALGGFADIPLMEDVELMRRIKKRGDPVVILPQKVMTSPRRWEKDGLVRCTLRNWLLQALYLAGVRPERLCRWYR